jgi:signal transduction histidine kinase
VSATAASSTDPQVAVLGAASRPNDPRSFKVLAGIVILIDLAVLGAGWAIERPSVVGWDLALWVALVACAGLVPLTSGEDGPNLSMDLPLLLGAAIVYGPVVAGTIAFVASFDTREVRRATPLTHALFNRAQVSLSVFSAGVAFNLLRGEIGSWPWVAVAAIGALCADVLVNYAAVAAMALLNRRKNLHEALAEMRFGPAEIFVPTYICFGFTSMLLAEAHVRLGFWGVLAFVVPIVLARQAFLHRKMFDSASGALRSRKQALSRVDERIAEERRDERQRIAEALHDEVLQSLYDVTIRTQVIREDIRLGRLLDLDSDVPALMRASELAVESLRDVIRNLHRSPVGHVGLLDTLILLINHLRDQTNLKFVADLQEVNSDPSTELLVYQIAREGLINAVKHSNASTVWIELRRTMDGILLEIQDNGAGFDPGASQDPRHFGLELMNERALRVHGRFAISSTPGYGARLSLLIPERADFHA